MKFQIGTLVTRQPSNTFAGKSIGIIIGVRMRRQLDIQVNWFPTPDLVKLAKSGNWVYWYKEHELSLLSSAE